MTAPFNTTGHSGSALESPPPQNPACGNIKGTFERINPRNMNDLEQLNSYESPFTCITLYFPCNSCCEASSIARRFGGTERDEKKEPR